jgi:hypothetical protein
MHPFRPVTGYCLVAVGFVLIFVAVWLIANIGGKVSYVVWGLGLLTMMLGLKFLPKKKQRRDDNRRDSPATEKQKSLARELGIKFPPSISKGDLSDLITEERASER